MAQIQAFVLVEVFLWKQSVSKKLSAKSFKYHFSTFLKKRTRVISTFFLVEYSLLNGLFVAVGTWSLFTLHIWMPNYCRCCLCLEVLFLIRSSSKSTIETQEKGVKYACSGNNKPERRVLLLAYHLFVVFLLLTLNK